MQRCRRDGGMGGGSCEYFGFLDNAALLPFSGSVVRGSPHPSLPVGVFQYIWGQSSLLRRRIGRLGGSI